MMAAARHNLLERLPTVAGDYTENAPLARLYASRRADPNSAPPQRGIVSAGRRLASFGSRRYRSAGLGGGWATRPLSRVGRGQPHGNHRAQGEK